MKKFLAIAAVVAVCGAMSAQAGEIRWSFDARDGQGNLTGSDWQGWQTLSSSSGQYLPCNLELTRYVPQIDARTSGTPGYLDDGIIVPGQTTGQLDSYVLSSTAILGNFVADSGVDASMHQVLWVRSPEFMKDGTRQFPFIEFYLAGAPFWNTEPDLPADAALAAGSVAPLLGDVGVNGVPAGVFVALRDVTTGTYVRQWKPAGDDGQRLFYHVNHELEDWGHDQMLDGHTYTLDVIDNANGNGWIAVDGIRIDGVVQVPEPSTVALLLAGLIGAAALVWRKR